MAKILVIEDSRLMRAMARTPLESAGHVVLEAEDGRQGLAVFERQHPDCIILDLNLPVMNGYEVLKHLRAIGTDVPVVVATADVHDATRRMCHEIGISTFLRKPYEEIELLACVNLALEMRGRVNSTETGVPWSVDILIVDDSKTMRKGIRNTIERESWKIREAAGGSEALEMIGAHPPDIILLDQEMPGLQGNDLLKILKNDDTTKDISVVMVTGMSQDDMIEEALSLGAAEFISKPFSKSALVSRIQNVVRTRMLLREQRQLREAADKANRSKSRFLANVTHELRSPLNSLLLLSQVLAANEDGKLNSRDTEMATVIHKGGQELLTLINDLLDLSKAEEGKLEIHFAGVKIESVVNHLTTQFVPLAQKNKVDYKIELSEDLPQAFRTDELRLKQILRNLLSNAFKFTPCGSITLRICQPQEDVQFKRRDLTPQNSYAFSVTDTGFGISSEKQQDIFEAFQQADRTTARDFGGTGLGLSISRELAQHLGGEIQLTSEEGKGSTFTLFLPRKNSDVEFSESDEVPAVAPERIRESQSGRTDASILEEAK